MAYDFSTLNDKEFEQFTRDILNKEFGFDFQDFRPGKDKGIDLRFSHPKNKNSFVLQAKHYLKSGIKILLSDLSKKELSKVESICPARYFISTSLPLSPQDKDQIRAIFHPFIQSENDIFGQEDLNKYLQKHPDIERAWYKLWLSSTEVLSTILNNGIRGRSQFISEKIKKDIQVFVITENYNKALEILSDHKYIMITGQPGIGKTSLANMLAYYYMSEGFELIHIEDDVRDAEQLFNPNPEAKQIFYFDDFLGANYLEILHPKTTESAFVNFLERIKVSKNKYLLLSTRTSVYQNALERYEKMKRTRIDLGRMELQLGDYTDLEKAQILYNHLYHSSIQEQFTNEIFINKNYWRIISHRNYNPRLIQFITTAINFPDLNIGGYFQALMTHLENPEEVWKYAYERQFSLEEKLLLHAVFSQRHVGTYLNTQIFFQHFLEYYVKSKNHNPVSNPYKSSLSKLIDGILKHEITTSSNTDTIAFINPSIKDFLVNYFLKNEESRLELFNASYHVEQFEVYVDSFFSHDRALRYVDAEKLATHLIKNANQIKSTDRLQEEENRTKYIQLKLAALIMRLPVIDDVVNGNIQEFVFHVVYDYNYINLTTESISYFLRIGIRCSRHEKLWVYLQKEFKQIVLKLLSLAERESDFEEIATLTEELEIDFPDFIYSKGISDEVYRFLNRYNDQYTAGTIEDEAGNVEEHEEWDRVKARVKKERSEMYFKFGLNDIYYTEDRFFDEYDVDELVRENLSLRDSVKKLNTPVETSSKAEKDQIRKVEELFVGHYDSKSLSAIQVASGSIF